jgi:hypothetical protein
MKPNHVLISWLCLVTLSNASARVRCAISVLAAVAELGIFLAWMNWSGKESNLLVWCWLIVLDVGFVAGTFGLSAAKNWRDRLTAMGLIGFHLFSFIVLFGIALLRHGTYSIH